MKIYLHILKLILNSKNFYTKISIDNSTCRYRAENVMIKGSFHILLGYLKELGLMKNYGKCTQCSKLKTKHSTDNTINIWFS